MYKLKWILIKYINRTKSDLRSKPLMTEKRKIPSTLKSVTYLIPAILLVSVITVKQIHSAENVNIGILAVMGQDETVKSWKPTADYLTGEIPEHKFRIIPLDHKTIEQAVEKNRVQFFITNPGNYVTLAKKYSATRIATRISLYGDFEYDRLGAVIFTKAGRNDINEITDLKGKKFIAAYDKSLTWWIAGKEMKDKGLDYDSDLDEILFTEYPHDNVVHRILKGEGDIGVVWAGIPEHMASGGEIDISDLKIINDRISSEFPLHVSSRLYPEWPLAKTRSTPDLLSRNVLSALFRMGKNHPAAKAAGIAGWTTPLPYEPVHQLMMEMRAGPYKDYGRITLKGIFNQYRYPFIISTLLFFTTILMSAIVFRLNSILRKTNLKLEKSNDILEERVKGRTNELLQLNRSLEEEIAEKEEAEATIKKINAELEKTNEDLNDTVQELQAMNEEYEAANEALIISGQELVKSEEEYRTLIENAGETILVIQDDIVKYSNSNSVMTTGYTPEEITGMRYSDITHPDDRERLLDLYRRRINNMPAPPLYTFRVIRKDGNESMLERHAAVIEWDNAPAVLVFDSDIQERIKAENIVINESERARILFELHDRSPGLSEKELFDFALDSAVALTESSIGFCHEIADDGNTIILTTWNKEAIKTCDAMYGHHYPVNEAGNWVDCLRGRRTVVYNDYSASPNRRGLPEGHTPVSRFMSIPVIEEGAVKIIFGVGNKDSDYTDMDVINLQIIANEFNKILSRRKLIKELQLSEERYRLLLENLQTGVIVYSPDKKIIMANTFASNLFGMAPGEMIGKNAADIMLCLKHKNGSDYDVSECPVNTVISSGKPAYSHLVDIRSPGQSDNSYALVNAVPVRDDEGNIYMIMETLTDISELTELKSELVESRENYRMMVENINDLICEVDEEGRFGYISPSYNKILGYEPENLLTENVRDLIHPDDLKSAGERYREILKDGKPYTDVLRFRNADNNWLWLECAGNVIKKKDGDTSVIFISRDVTAKKRLEEESRIDDIRLMTLLELSQKKTESVQEIIDTAVEGVIRLSESEFGLIYFYDSGMKLFTGYAWSTGILDQNTEHTKEFINDLRALDIWKKAVHRKKPLIINEKTTVEKRPAYVPDINRLMAVPVFYDGEIVAVAGVVNKETLYTSFDTQQLTMMMNSVWSIIKSRESEILLRQNEERYRILFDESAVSIWEEDFSAVKDYFNDLKAQGVTDFREYFMNNPCAVLHCAELVKIVSINNESRRLLKIEREDVSGSLIDFFIKESIPVFREELIALSEGYKSFKTENSIIREDGEIIQVMIYLSVVPEYNPPLGRVLVSFIDITDRKNAEEELMNYRDRLEEMVLERTKEVEHARYRNELILDSVGDGIYGVNRDGNITFINPAAARMLGWEQEELIGKHGHTLLHHTGKDGAPQPVEECRIYSAFINNRQYHVEEDYFWRKNGEGFLVEFISTPIVSGNSVIGAVVVFRDITERLKAEKALSEERNLLKTLINSLPDQIYAKDSEGKFILANSRALETLSIRSMDMILNKTDYDLIPAERAAIAHNEEMELLNRTKERINREEEVYNPDSGSRHFYITKVPLLDRKGTPYGIVGINRDISEIKTAEKKLKEAKETAESANIAKSRFLSSMSHEIRTPMHAILGFSQLMMHDPEVTSRQMERLETINRSGEHLLSLINDILELSKIEAGRTELNVSSFNVHSLLQDIDMMFRLKTESKGIKLILELMPGLPKYIKTDQGKLRQILINLIGNAVKFTSEGGIAVRAGFRQQPDKNSILIIDVEDTGVGISQKDAGRIFRVFEQAEEGVMSGGTGLGLPISIYYARLLGGDIEVKSDPGRGSVFSLNIKCETAVKDENPVEETKKTVIKINSPSKNYRILVVDDKTDNRKLLTEILENAGFTVIESENGLEAVNIFKKEYPDMVLMDLNMPVMNGYDAIREIRKAENGSSVPVIAVTASAFEEDRITVLSTGATDYLRKPFRQDEFFDMIKKYLRIEYLYEEITDVTSQEKYGLSLKTLQNELMSLSEDSRASMYEAALNLDQDLILEIISGISLLSDEAVNEMNGMVKKYQFDMLIELLKKNGGSDGTE